MKENPSNYFFVSYEKEQVDSKNLIAQIAKSGWIDRDVIIINCSPDYSSRLSQMMNHKLSYLNNNETFEVVDLPMPYPTMSQVWDTLERKYVRFDNYLYDWVRKYIQSDIRYLFVDSGTLRGQNFTKVKNAIKGKLEPDQYRFASLYLQSDSIFEPDFYTEKFDKKNGGLLFEWENVNNPNWDY